MAKAEKDYKPTMSDAAVKAKTGKTWAQWFGALDKLGAKKLPHPEIADLLAEKFGVPPWWTQMVTVQYERARGLRAMHQLTDGFSLSASTGDQLVGHVGSSPAGVGPEYELRTSAQARGCSVGLAVTAVARRA